MNERIIETGSDFPNVLLYRDREDHEIVTIQAWGNMEETENMIAVENIEFEDAESARAFIKDYSIESAEKWCLKKGITYGSYE